LVAMAVKIAPAGCLGEPGREAAALNTLPCACASR
jgi:hypothetical protein